MKFTTKWFTQVVEYNKNSNLDNNNQNVKFFDINLLYNKLSLQFLANNFITHIKKRWVTKTDN